MSNKKNNWGGARPGAGRPKTPGRKKTMFFVTEDEKIYLKSCLEAYRAAGGPTNDEFEEELEHRGQQQLPLV